MKKLTFGLCLLALAGTALADILTLPLVGESKTFTRTYDSSHLAKHQGQLFKKISLTITNSDEEDGIDRLYVSFMALTVDGVKVTGESGHCDELPQKLGVVCSIVDSRGGDILLTDSALKGKVSLFFRPQKGVPVTLLDKSYNEVIVPADAENSVYALNVAK